MKYQSIRNGARDSIDRDRRHMYNSRLLFIFSSSPSRLSARHSLIRPSPRSSLDISFERSGVLHKKSTLPKRHRGRSRNKRMVRISIPTIKPHPHPLPPSALTLLPVKEAAQHLSEFLAAGKGETLVLSGAGVSVDSGIRAYRGKEGHYSNPNYTYVWFWFLGGNK